MSFSKLGSKPYLATRRTKDTHAFLQEEKFETYLDLSDIILFSKACKSMEVWETKSLAHLNHLISSDSISLLHHYSIRPHEIPSMIITPTLPAKLVSHMLSANITRCHMSPGRFLRHLERVRQAALMSMNYQFNHLISNCSSDLSRYLIAGSNIWDEKMAVWPKEVMNSYAVMEDLLFILEVNKVVHEYHAKGSTNQRAISRVNMINKKYKSVDGKIYLPSLQAIIQITHNVAVLTWKGARYLLNHDLLLEFINKGIETHCALLYSYLMSGTSMMDTHYTNFVNFLSHISGVVMSFCTGRNCAVDIHYENSGFKYLKVMEGLGVSEIILREDSEKGWVNRSLQDHLWASVYDDGISYCRWFDDSELARILHDSSIASVAEFIGCVKLCGHPSIEIEEGLQKLYDRTHANIIVDNDHVDRAIAVCKRDLCINYHNKYNHYPTLVNIDAMPESPIKTLVKFHVPPNSPRGIQLRNAATLLQWNDIELGKNDEYDPIDNQLVLLKDKALGVARSKIIRLMAVDTVVKGERRQLSLGDLKERRCLLRFLLDPHMSEEYKHFSEAYMNENPWSSNVTEYLVFKMTPKEGEEKNEGRFFGASPWCGRAIRQVQESNVHNHMASYVPDQTMTPDELAMLKKLYSFRIFNRVYPGHTLLQVSFDFSKWNNSMRSDSIDKPAKETLDKWYGVDIFGRTMESYEHTYVYYNDGIRKRDWEGQYGGIDGMHQFTWSYIFTAGIKQALEQLGIIYQVNVKGDDVRAVLAIRSENINTQELIERMRDQVLLRLQELCNAMGWTLNPHECFVSLALISTSKQYQVNDTFLPASTKRACKSMSLSNLLFPTLEDIISNIFSTCHSACAQGTSLLAPFMLALICACGEFDREYTGREHLTVDELAILTMWPQVLGGPGPLPLQTYILRGENDMLSVVLSLYRYILHNYNNKITDMIRAILAQKVTENPDPKLLLGNPYSIPLEVPERPSALIKKLMRRKIIETVEHPQLKDLLSVKSEADENDLITCLTSCKPYMAKPMTVVWECSPFYIIEEIISRFTESSTVFAYLGMKKDGKRDVISAHKALKSVMLAAVKRHSYWLQVIRSHDTSNTEWLGVPYNKWVDTKVCTAWISHEVRKSVWHKEVLGITYPSLVEQCILGSSDYFNLVHPEWDLSAITSVIHIPKDQYIYQTTDRYDHYATIPGNVPWLGSTTVPKGKLPRVQTDVHSPTQAKIGKLLGFLVNGELLGDTFVALVKKCIEALTCINFNDLQVLVPEEGANSISHRAAINAYNMTTMPNYRPNFLQIVDIPQDSGGALRGDTTNRSVNFAARHYFDKFLALLPLQSMNNLPLDYPTQMLTVFHNDNRYPNVYRVCPDCCKDIDDVPITISNVNSLNLTDYKYIPLVGCSLYDNKIIRQKIDKLTEHKVRRHELAGHPDIQMADVILLASFTTFSAYASSKRYIFEMSHGANFAKIPTGELAELLMIGMSKKSVDKVSINALRCISAINLYNCVLSLYVEFMINLIGCTDAIDNLEKSYFIMAHLNPMSPILRDMADCGLLSSVKLGCDQAGYIDNFQWSAGSLSSPGLAAESFNRQHVHLIKDWVMNSQPLPQVTLFCNAEDEESIIGKFERYMIQYKLMLFRSLRLPLNHDSLAIHAARFCATYDIVDILDEHTYQIGVDMGMFDVTPVKTMEEIRDILLDEFTDLDGLDRLIRNRDWKLKFLSYIKSAFMIDIRYSAGNWIDDDYIVVTPGSQYNILGLRNEEQINLMIEWPNEGFTKETRPVLSLLCEQLGEDFCFAMYDLVMNNDMYDLNETIEESILRVFERCDDILACVNTRVVGVMRLEDARKILQDNNVSLTKIIKDARVAIHERLQNEQVNPDQDRHRVCLLQGGRDCDRFATRQVTPLYNPPMRQEYCFPGNTGCLVLGEDDVRNKYYDDKKEVARCVGINNTSVGKYAHILHTCGMDYILRTTQHSVMAVCLADGLGGVTAHLLQAYRNIMVLYNSLQKYQGQLVSDSSITDVPIEVGNLPIEVEALTRVIYQGLYPGDLTLKEMPSMVINYVRTKCLPVYLMTCDADICYTDNLESAYKMWINVLRIFHNLSDEITVNILKIFALDHPVIHYIMQLCSILFSHVHYYRNPITRNRSTEFFIIMSQPRQILITNEQWDDLRTKKKFFGGNLENSTDFHNILHNIAIEYTTYRRIGNSHGLDLQHIYTEYSRCGAMALNPTLYLTLLGVPYTNVTCNLVDFPITITGQLYQSLNSVVSLMRSCRPVRPRQVPSIRGKHKRQISFGHKLPLMLIRKIIRIHVMIFVLDKVRSGQLVHTIDLASDIMTYLENIIYDMSEGWENEWTLVGHDGQLFYLSRSFNDNLTMFIHMCLRKSLHIVGAYYYTLFVLNYHFNRIGRIPDDVPRNLVLFLGRMNVDGHTYDFIRNRFMGGFDGNIQVLHSSLLNPEYIQDGEVYEDNQIVPHGFRYEFDFNNVQSRSYDQVDDGLMLDQELIDDQVVENLYLEHQYNTEQYHYADTQDI